MRWTIASVNPDVLEALGTVSQEPQPARRARRQQARSIQDSISTPLPQEAQCQTSISTTSSGAL